MRSRSRCVYLKIIRGESCLLGDACKHPAPQLFPVVESEHHIGPSFALQRSMRARLSLDDPPDAKECSQNAASAGRGPLSHELRYDCEDILDLRQRLSMLQPFRQDM